ncbi:MAG: Histidyl-tRNA synthetase [Candidatus Woesebacteria bacterium GW2011_GWA2_40_7]|uniref:Histidyl-tRNA synthetase n=1 Tax=Candidatus Woesebacteria bacterium GW2011_GWA2_40_7 TaxID=1618562 RepID=A0A0G0VKX5_9BACT|nr:MAG: Histidyl-tRNA synthetase [Candidatus Woesebacteria bacterium GW2011_GWA2_40_7]
MDIFGVATTSADAEVIAENLDTYLAIGFKKPVVIFNNRDLMKDIPYSAIVAIDKLKKIGEQGVINNMVQKGINKSQASDYLKFVMDMKPDATVKTIISYLEKSGFGREYYRFEPTLARSFSYSQGPIWEIIIEDYETGSVGGGERYDGMMKRLTGLDIPATGIAFGFDRTVEAADQLNLIPEELTKTKALVTIFAPDLLENSIKVACDLRENKINTELYPNENAKLDKQLKYADKKGIPYVLIIGPEEVKESKVVLKNLKTKEQTKTTIENVISLVK